MEIKELKPNLLVQTPRNEVLKVSTIYGTRPYGGPDRVSAQVLYPKPDRTAVRYYTAEDVLTWREPTDAIIAKYEIAWGFR